MKSKEEVLKQLKKSEGFNRKMLFVKNELYPALLNASKNIDDTQFFLGSLGSMIMQKFIEKMKDTKFSTLGLTDILDPKDNKYVEYRILLELFNDMNAVDVRDIIEGMKNEIQLFVNEEMRARPLSSLKTKWLDDK